jgi:hypothetical protein
MATSLVVTVLLIVAALHLAAARMSNSRPGGTGRVFLCKIRPAGRLDHPLKARWPLRRCRAAWAHDVLIVSRGLTFPRVTALAVRMPEETLRQTCAREVRGLGAHPLVIVLRLDNDRLIEIATRSSHRTDLVGPFMAAAIPGLPAGPKEQPNVGR